MPQRRIEPILGCALQLYNRVWYLQPGVDAQCRSTHPLWLRSGELMHFNRARQIGGFSNYMPLIQNGIESIGFDSYFPSSYILDPSAGKHCKDLKWPILAFQICMLFIFSILLRPTPALFFWVSCCAGFWQIVLTKGPRE